MKEIIIITLIFLLILFIFFPVKAGTYASCYSTGSYPDPRFPVLDNPWPRGPLPQPGLHSYRQFAHPRDDYFPWVRRPHWQPEVPWGGGAPTWYYSHPRR